MTRAIPLLPVLFRIGARLRNARAFHPRGVCVQATWSPAAEVASLAGSPLLAEPRRAVVRVSHGVGLPPSFPDLVGLAVKVPDVYGVGRDQDLLLTSSGRGTIGRHLLRPRRQLRRITLSTLLPYEIPGIGRRAVVARPAPGSPPVSYAEVSRDPAACPVFEIRLGRVAGPLLATVEPDGAMPQDLGEALRFDPWHTGSELRPVGWLNRVRRPTYAASREGRGAAPAPRDAVPATAGHPSAEG